MKRKLVYENQEAFDSVYDWLRGRMHFPRSIVSALRSGEIDYRVNGERLRLWYPLPAKSQIEIYLEDSLSSPFAAVDLPLNICYEDEDLLVVNKPAFMPSHPAMNHQEDTLANAVLFYYQSRGIPFVYRIVNRLDRDTSGLVLICKNALASARMKEQIDQRQLHREYLCLIEGSLRKDSHLENLPHLQLNRDRTHPLFCDTTAKLPLLQGKITAPIARKPTSLLEREVNESLGQSAVTYFELLGEGRRYSLLRVWLGTGRTHQIRVHMKYIGHPLPGDFLYHPQNQDLPRQALHSASLEFEHPINHELCQFQAPLPEDMRALMQRDGISFPDL